MQTCLYASHIDAGGKMVDFSGWQMPIHYGSQIEEHIAVRQHAGVFDVSHMTVIDVTGKDATTFLRHLLANDVVKLSRVGQALYSAMLDERGGIIDDLMVYRGPDGYRLVVNCGTREKDLVWLQTAAAGFDVLVEEAPHLAILAVQGPKAMDLLGTALTPHQAHALAELKPFECAFSGQDMIARTGYTGELGAELILAADAACALWDRLRALGVKPAGLGARDTLRLEAGLNLYGSDMDEQVTPSACNLSWTVVHNGRDFIGEKALLAEKEAGGDRRLIGVVMTDRGVLRSGHPIVSGGREVGVITSGAFSPSLQRGIGFARIEGANELKAPLLAVIRGREMPVLGVTLPFVRRGKACFKPLV